jgi:hypothetical protein
MTEILFKKPDKTSLIYSLVTTSVEATIPDKKA